MIMQFISVTPWNTCCYYNPKHFTLNFSSRNKCKFVTRSSSRHSCKQQQENHKNSSDKAQQKRIYWQELYTSGENEKPNSRRDKEETRIAVNSHSSILLNRWWAVIRAALGQRINLEGIAFSVGIFSKNKHLAIPHVLVPDIRYIDWAELKRRGFQGVVFDKDNTITVPYSLNLWPPLASSIDHCKSLFDDNIAVFSNSAGLNEYDPDGRNARILERAIGIKVIRHRVKKPAGTAEEIERQFGCESSRLIMVGDRPFSDIVYGNRNGFLTILTEPLSASKEPFIVQQVRILEMALVNRWSRKGLKPISHWLLPDYRQCVKDEPF